MVTRPIRTSLVDEVTNKLLLGIKQGRYVPGQRLIEADLTTELGVSRGPIREALSRLASTGVLVIEPHRGAVVRRLTRRDVEELFEIREVLEGQAARLAASNMNLERQEQFKTFAKNFRALQRRRDAIAFAEENSAFHEAVLEASSNTLLRTLISQLAIQAFRGQFRSSVDTQVADDANEGHQEIIAALIERDPDRAERLMRHHVRCSAERALSQPDSFFA
jgi:DNA-binding GntR family transcriptional regulator